MKVGLLDVNMLIALGWTSHAHHDQARKWLANNRLFGWATCPTTQCAFIRLSSNPAFTPDAVAPADAVSMLRELTAAEGHHFWPADLPCDSDKIPSELLTGHRQVTDAYLLGLARRYRGKLITLDQKLASVFSSDRELGAYLELISV